MINQQTVNTLLAVAIKQAVVDTLDGLILDSLQKEAEKRLGRQLTDWDRHILSSEYQRKRAWDRWQALVDFCNQLSRDEQTIRDVVWHHSNNG